MSTPKTVSSVYLLPGMTAKLKVTGYYIASGQRKVQTFNGTYELRDLVNGYAVVDSETGELEAVPDEPAVLYKHKKYGLNKVYFFARTGEISIVDIIAVPIHDHSSVVTGGPAYGTYFTDDETTT
jgi:hypothetical protein